MQRKDSVPFWRDGHAALYAVLTIMGLLFLAASAFALSHQPRMCITRDGDAQQCGWE